MQDFECVLDVKPGFSLLARFGMRFWRFSVNHVKLFFLA